MPEVTALVMSPANPDALLSAAGDFEVAVEDLGVRIFVERPGEYIDHWFIPNDIWAAIAAFERGAQ